MYLWERPRWPSLTWDERSLSTLLAAVSRQQGRLLGRMEALGFDLRDEAHLQTLTEDVVKRFFKGIARGRVIRHELDNLLGLNFLLEQALGGGGTVSLMLDPQGKTLSQALLEMEVRVPAGLLRGIR